MSKEMISLLKTHIPAATHLTRVVSLKVIIVTFNTKLSFESHFLCIIQSAARSIYGLKTLRAHGPTGKSLRDVTQATLIARITYAVCMARILKCCGKKGPHRIGYEKSQALRLPTKRFWKCAYSSLKYGSKTFWQRSVQYQPCFASATTSWKGHSL